MPGNNQEIEQSSRVAKVIARAGLCSRREAERWIEQGQVAVNGKQLNSPAYNVTPEDTITVNGEPLPRPAAVRLWRYHKPKGLVTTHRDPEGRRTVFDALPPGLPRVIAVGRLDLATEGLLLLTSDGGLARHLELPSTGWLRRYRVRAHGHVTQAALDALKKGKEIEGIQYGPATAQLDKVQGANCWITISLKEGKNREVKKLLASLGLKVNRLLRLSYGPFALGELKPGELDEIDPQVVADQLGAKMAKALGLPSGAQARKTKAKPKPKLKPKPKGKKVR